MRFAVIGDIHNPYADDRAIDLTCHLLEAFQPDEVCNVGDGFDFYQLSPFDQDPARRLAIQDDLDISFEVNKRLKSAAPRADWYYIEANHERRLWRYLTRHPELYNLDALKLENLLRLDELGWTLIGGRGAHSFRLRAVTRMKCASALTCSISAAVSGCSSLSNTIV